MPFPRLALAGLAVAVLATAAPAADKKKTLAQPVKGYTHKKIEGFDLLIHDEVMAHNDDEEFKRKPLDVLEYEIGTVARVLPKRIEDKLKAVLIWVEWHDETDPDIGQSVAKYYGVWGNRAYWSLNNTKHPGKANSVEVISMRSLAKEHQPDRKSDRCVMLHEFAHAVHAHVVGGNSPQVLTAFNQAMDRKLYDEADDVNGNKIRPYARTNDHEYFAEITCAYLNKLHYFPFDRDGLQKHDAAGYKLMETVWGKAKDIDKALKTENEKAASQRVLKAKTLVGDKKTKADGVKLLEYVTAFLPDTAAAKEAKKLLEKHAPSEK